MFKINNHSCCTHRTHYFEIHSEELKKLNTLGYFELVSHNQPVSTKTLFKNPILFTCFWIIKTILKYAEFDYYQS